jgi:PKD repeat protein
MKIFTPLKLKNLKNRISVLAALFFALSLNAQVGIINTIAGSGIYGYYGDGGLADTCKFSSPGSLAVDISGNIYIADYSNNRIRKITASAGIITTVAGSGNCCGNPGNFSGDGGPATSATLNQPYSIAIDAVSGNIYVADGSNNRIRKLTLSTGVITTIAGDSTGRGFSGDGGLAINAKLASPSGVALDDSGNIYISDCINQRIRKVTKATGIINTIAGNGKLGYSGDGGPADSAEFRYPYGLAVDDSGNIYVPDMNNNCIRKITKSTGIIHTIAGNGTYGFAGDGGPATSAGFEYPAQVTLDKYGNIYIADQGDHCIRKITKSTGKITTIAGIGQHNGFSGDGGLADTAKLFDPWGVAVDSSGNIFISDEGNVRIRKVTYIKLPAINFTANNSAVCTGDSVHFTDNSTNGPTKWNWTFTGGTPASSKVQNPTVLYNSPGTYTVKLKESNLAGSDSLIKTSYIQVNPHPTVSISGESRICQGKDILSAIDSGASPFTYNWSNGGTYDTIVVNKSNTYSVTVTDSKGCKSTSNINVVKDSVPIVDICMVSVDSTSTKNVIIWDKPAHGAIDSFRIYREIASSYVHIASLPYIAYSVYTDTTNGINSNTTSYKYKLSAVDTCGTESALSPLHQTIHVAIGPASPCGYNLIWNDYIGFSIAQYRILRDSANTGWKVKDSVSFGNTSWTDATCYPTGVAVSYQVEAVNPVPCNPTAQPFSPNVISTRSNKQSNNVTGINSINVNSDAVKVYPNPAEQMLNVKFNYSQAGLAEISVTDVTGRIIMAQSAEVNIGSLISLNVSGLTPGVYFVAIKSKTSVQQMKFIKE